MTVMTIGEICDLLNGYSFKSDKYENDGIRVIRIQNVQKGYLEDPTPVFYPKKYEKELKKYMLEENDILVSLTGNVGRVALMEKRFLPAGLNQRVACLRIKNKSIVDIKYLFYILLSKNFEDNCIFSSHGAAQLNLSTEWIKNYKIPVPTLSEQKKIIEELDLILSAISENEKRLDLYDEMIKSKFNEMFGDINTIGNIELMDLCTKITDGSHNPPSGVAISNNYMISAKNINNGKIDYDDIRFLSDSDFNVENKRTNIKKGDVLLTIVGAIGRSAVVNTNDKIVCQRSICVLKPDNKKVNSIFLKYMLDFMYHQIDTTAHGAAQKGIYLNEVKKLKCICPVVSEQEVFVDYVINVDKLIVETQNKIKNYQELLDSKMNEYFNK